MTIMQVTDVVAVLDGRVTAVGTMYVVMIFVNLVCHEAFLQFQQSVVTSTVFRDIRIGVIQDVPQNRFDVLVGQPVEQASPCTPSFQ